MMGAALIKVLWVARWVEIARRSCSVVHDSCATPPGPRSCNGRARQELTLGIRRPYAGCSLPLLTIVNAIATFVTVAIQQAAAILAARELVIIVEARSFDGANRTVVIGDIDVN
jgi:hypothetical protein